jgi:hypothetical protein
VEADRHHRMRDPGPLLGRAGESAVMEGDIMLLTQCSVLSADSVLTQCSVLSADSVLRMDAAMEEGDPEGLLNTWLQGNRSVRRY